MILRKLDFLMAPEGAAAAAPATATPAPASAAAPATATPAPGAAPAGAAPAATPGTLLSGDGQPKGETPASADIKITVPKDFTVDQKRLDGFVAFAKENKISQENAQKFFDAYVEQQQTDAKAAQTTRVETITGWAEESRKAFGKDFDQTIANAKRALRAFGDEEVDKLLTESGLGNHKSVIRLLSLVGTKVAEDKLPAKDGSPAKQPVSQDDKLKAMYDKSPEMFQGKEQ